MSDHYTKVLNSEAALRRELAGHEFMRHYFSQVPNILAIRTNGRFPELDVARVDGKGSAIVTDALRRGDAVDVRELFKELARVANTFGSERAAQGGTRQFYLQRRPKLASPVLQSCYRTYLADNSGQRVGTRQVMLRARLMEEIRARINTFAFGYCIPTQGDVHERNMATNNFLLDFEGGGWNLLAGDIATFIWHTLFAGSYFGPKYAKWSGPIDKVALAADRPQLIADGRSVRLQLHDNRAQFLHDYLTTYFHALTVVPEDMDICAAIAFRMLTVFPPHHMELGDQTITFTLANFFMDPKLSLETKLKTLDRSLHDVALTPRRLRPARDHQLVV